MNDRIFGQALLLKPERVLEAIPVAKVMQGCCFTAEKEGAIFAQAGLAFLLKDDIDASFCLPFQILSAVQGIVPAIRLSRPDSGEVKYLFGEKLCPVYGLNLKTEGVVIEKDFQIIASNTSACLDGNPLQAVSSFLKEEANKKIDGGTYLYVGPLATPAELSKGSCIDVFFTNLGHIRAEVK